jgi:hypothetical protein
MNPWLLLLIRDYFPSQVFPAFTWGLMSWRFKSILTLLAAEVIFLPFHHLPASKHAFLHRNLRLTELASAIHEWFLL